MTPIFYIHLRAAHDVHDQRVHEAGRRTSGTRFLKDIPKLARYQDNWESVRKAPSTSRSCPAASRRDLGASGGEGVSRWAAAEAYGVSWDEPGERRSGHVITFIKLKLRSLAHRLSHTRTSHHPAIAIRTGRSHPR